MQLALVEPAQHLLGRKVVRLRAHPGMALVNSGSFAGRISTPSEGECSEAFRRQAQPAIMRN